MVSISGCKNLDSRCGIYAVIIHFDVISVLGCKHEDAGCGIFACDPEGYNVFQDILNPVIKDYHQLDEIQHPKPDFGDLNNLGFGDLDPSGEFIVSTRVRVARSHEGFGFPPVVNTEVSHGMDCRFI
jgi:hypothetical protein